MKPITLTMKAFGSFVKETPVYFSEIKTGLYLIVGETGAGKTTVFDAIVFALYGAASGSNRKPDMLHSDYVERSEDTVVKLVFDQGGKEYEVTRTIHFQKKRGTANEYREGKLDAVLMQPDAAPVRGHDAVTKRCVELLGLNADQFRKIVMLAQGEFREFLSADAAKKSEILGKLFDNSEYIRYQNLLNASRAALASKRKECRDRVETVMRTTFQMPEEESEEAGERYLAGNPELLADLDRLIQREAQKGDELTVQKTAAQKAVDEINKNLGAAESNNQKLDELSAARAHARQLSGQKEEMDRLAQQYALAEKALHRVLPAREKWLTAKNAAETAENKIAELRKKLSTMEQERDAARETIDGDKEAQSAIREIDSAHQKLKDSLPDYDVLAEKRTEKDKEAKARKDIVERLADTQEKRKQTEELLRSDREALAQLGDTGADIARAEARSQLAAANSKEFSGGDGIRIAVEDAVKNEKKLLADEQILADLTLQAAAANEHYHRQYRAFIDGQAGLLAAELKAELDSRGSAVCPVCGSIHHAGQGHKFAIRQEATPTQDEVDKAKEKFDALEKERSTHYADVKACNEKLEGERSALLLRGQKLLPDCRSWEQLSSKDYLEATAALLQKAKGSAECALADANSRQKRKDDLTRQCEQLSEALKALDSEIEKNKDQQTAAEKRLSALDAELRTLTDKLSCGTREEAERQINSLTEKRGRLQAQIDGHQKAFDTIQEELNKAYGELRAKETALPDQVSAGSDARQRFDAALSTNGFEDDDALEAALTPMGAENREDWLEQQQARINDYRNDCANTAERIKALTEQTEQLHYTDIENLKIELSEASAARDKADSESARQQALLKNHRSSRKMVSEALREIKNTDNAWERLDRLAEAAMGSNSESGRLSFERYVMGSFFREVLDMANIRLDIMSGGAYSLRHSTNAGRANSAAGLEIEICDAITGKLRPASSLSGGESFQVSLSLALGLSDVVQNHAGGMRLETIFIDEGFGTLDSGALDNAITVLKQLSEGNRLVGIISHVEKLEECIPEKLRVKKTAHGSELVREVS